MADDSHWLTVVVLWPRSTWLTSRKVKSEAAWGGAAENHGCQSQTGHIFDQSGICHSRSKSGLAHH